MEGIFVLLIGIMIGVMLPPGTAKYIKDKIESSKLMTWIKGE
jgi:hypothetical protein